MKPVIAWKLTLLGIGLLAAMGCQRLMNQEAAVQKAIQDHLAQRSDLAMDKMVMEVQQVNVNGDSAQAEVVFSVPGDPQMSMAFSYVLHRESGRWIVDGGAPSGAVESHPSMDGSMAGEAGAAEPLNLPDDHPPLGSTMPEPPEGHPPMPEANPHADAPLPSESR